MAKEQYLVIHCAETYPSMVLSKAILQEWHMSPRDEKGEIVYLGKRYPNREALPDDYINGKSIKVLYGRGWDRCGYRELIHRDGSVETITPHNHDGWISNEEMTWGQPGFNATGVHICLEGGLLSKPYPQPPLKGAEVILYPPEQIEALTNYILVETASNPFLKVPGHNQLNSQKNCPNFDVPEFLRKINRPQFIYP